ncbi:MAG TPA: DISARM system phospholipase D-like protein DrmC [Thermoanaerobaculia bacterium]|nr:DISARM system phospholipase D-like protein DrmC [Thermoanaerobaculia bacterium]
MGEQLELTGVPQRVLEALAEELARSPEARLTTAQVARVGGQAYSAQLEPLGALAPEATIAVLQAVAAERRAKHGPELELVWTGPEASVSHSRSSAVVLRRLFEQAQRTVLIGGYAFDHGAELFAPLHGMMTERGVETEIFLDLREIAKPGVEPEAFARDRIQHFLRHNWPFEGRKPVIYYDPRTAQRGASLHAKCVVVDGKVSLITSANFTDRGQTRNLELGVLIRDRGFAETLVGQWRGLVAQGIVRRYEG